MRFPRLQQSAAVLAIAALLSAALAAQSSRLIVLMDDDDYGFRVLASLATYGWNLDPALTGTLNQAADVFTGPTQLMANSGDLTGAAWVELFVASIDDATHYTPAAQFGGLVQNVSTADGVLYTLYFRAAVPGGAAILYYHDASASGNSTAETLTATLADYAVTVLGKAGGGDVTFALLDNRTSAWTSIEITRQMVIPGTWTAEEAAQIYQAVAASNQTAHDWSGNGNDAIAGADTDAATDDPATLVESYNEIRPGMSDDLTVWSLGWPPVVTTNTVEDDDAAKIEYIHDTFTAADATPYLLSVWILKDAVAATTRWPQIWANVNAAYKVGLDTSTGNTGEVAGLGGSHTVTDTGTHWRLSMHFVTDDAAGIQVRINPAAGVNADLVSATGSALGTIGVSQNQLTQVPAGWSADDPLPYQSSAEPSITCFHCDYVTDDLSTVDPLALPANWALTLGGRFDDVTSVGLLSNGASDPAVSIDASSKVSYTNGTDTVASTNAIPAGLWHLISVVRIADTVYHYLNGVANGSGDVSSVSNAFTALTIGYDGSAYMDATSLFVSAVAVGWSPAKVKRTHCEMAQEMWDERTVPFLSAVAACPTLSFE